MTSLRGVAWSEERRMGAFWSKVDKRVDGCWIWMGYSKHGYGYSDTGFALAGERRVHRFVWTIMNGPIAHGVDLHHKVCEIKLCCNPSHLVEITHEDHAAITGRQHKGKRYGAWGKGTPFRKRPSTDELIQALEDRRL